MKFIVTSTLFNNLAILLNTAIIFVAFFTVIMKGYIEAATLSKIPKRLSVLNLVWTTENNIIYFT